MSKSPLELYWACAQTEACAPDGRWRRTAYEPDDAIDGEIARLRSQLEVMAKELDEERAKVGLLIQPIPEVHGDFPWQMVRLWMANRDVEKHAAREERDELLAQIRAQQSELEHLRRVLDAVWSFTDLDPEHTISCHADTLPEAYRQACAAIDAAKEAGTPDERQRKTKGSEK